MDPRKLKEAKKLIKRKSKLANLKRIKDLSFKTPDKLVLCTIDNLFSTNNQIRNIPLEVSQGIEKLLQDWITKTEKELDKELEEL